MKTKRRSPPDIPPSLLHSSPAVNGYSLWLDDHRAWIPLRELNGSEIFQLDPFLLRLSHIEPPAPEPHVEAELFIPGVIDDRPTHKRKPSSALPHDLSPDPSMEQAL